MVNETALEDYSNSIKRLKEQFRDAGLSENEFKNLYYESLREIEKEQLNNLRRKKFYKWTVLLTLCIGLVVVLWNARLIYSNLQECIYPGLRYLRKAFLPVVAMFPSLTEYYHETCLLQNPFFTVVDMDCWPCSNINNIYELDEPTSGPQQNAPFFYKTNQEIINIEKLKHFYSRNKIVFDMESPKILMNNKYYTNPSQMFDNLKGADQNLYIWKFNTMNSARTLRQKIHRPKVVPKFGQSTERYLLLDSSKMDFSLPDTECNFSFLLVLSGSRVIELNPTDECRHQCKSLKLELKETYLLWYNWWYWKPRVHSTSSNETFIAHLGSYC